jgi:AraC-like DNA-binding protein
MEPKYRFYFSNDYRPLSSLSVHEAGCMEYPANHTISLEKPESYALYIVVKGKGAYTLEDREFPAEEGHCFVGYPGIPLVCRADPAEPWTLCWVCFDGADARLLLNAAGFSPQNPIRSPRTVNQAIDVIAHIYTFRGKEVYALVQSTALLYTLMAFLIKEISWDNSNMPSGWTGVVHVQKALDYIASNYSRSITVNDIAAHVNLSRSRLYRVFVQHLSQSPQKYLMEFRIREACNLLQKHRNSIKEIARAVGFENPLNFSTAFKQIMGKSPRNYMQDFITGQSDSLD